MSSAGEIRRQVEHESERRSRLAVPAFAGGVMYLLSSIIVASTLNGAPTVGLLQGLAPALSGVANPSVSPRVGEVKFISHRAFPLIAGSVLAAVSIGALTLILLMLLDAARFRRTQIFAAARPLVLGGGIAFALVGLGHQVVTAIQTHNFAVGHDFSDHAVEKVLTTGTLNVTIEYLDLLAGLALAAGMIVVMINVLRVGLLPRWMAIIGIFAAVLIFLPIGGAEFEIVPAFWLVMMGVLCGGRWPNGDPPAWAAGEARPWPSRADMQAARRGQAQPALAAEVAPAPAVANGSSRKRRRKRSSRG